MSIIENSLLDWVEFNPTMMCQAPLQKKQPEIRGKFSGCSYCYAAEGMPHKPEDVQAYLEKELSTKQVKTFIDQLAKLNIPRISILGGEPQLRKDFDQIISYACKKIPLVALTTNGIHTKLHLESLLKIHTIDISLDSHVVALGRKVRPEAIILTALEAINLLHKKHPFLCVNAVVTPFTLESLDEFIRWAFQEKSIKKINLYPILDSNLENLYINEKQATSLIKNLKKKYTIYREVYCKAGKHVIVNYDGSIIPCAAFIGEDTKLGDISNVKKAITEKLINNFRKYDFRSVAPKDEDRFESANCFGKKLYDSKWKEQGALRLDETIAKDHKYYCMRCNYEKEAAGENCKYCGFGYFDTKQLSMVCSCFSLYNPKFFP